MRYTPLHALKFGQVFMELTPDAVRLCTFSFKYPIAVLKIVLATMGRRARSCIKQARQNKGIHVDETDTSPIILVGRTFCRGRFGMRQ